MCRGGIRGLGPAFNQQLINFVHILGSEFDRILVNCRHRRQVDARRGALSAFGPGAVREAQYTFLRSSRPSATLEPLIPPSAESLLGSTRTVRAAVVREHLTRDSRGDRAREGTRGTHRVINDGTR
jgi:hypothetical protein